MQPQDKDKSSGDEAGREPSVGENAYQKTKAKQSRSEKKAKKLNKKIEKLEKKDEKLQSKLDAAKSNLPKKRKLRGKVVFEEAHAVNEGKLTFEKEVVPYEKAKWNKKAPLPIRMATAPLRAAASAGLTKAHQKVHQVEHENVGTAAAHKAELLGERAAHGGKRKIKSAYRWVRNRPYRKVAKLEQKSIKNKMKLDYKTVVRDNPKLQKNPLARHMQKRRIKKQYAKASRASRFGNLRGGPFGRAIGGISRMVNDILRRNPIAVLKLALMGLLIIGIVSMFSLCMSLLQGGASFVGGSTYAAEPEDINSASGQYVEWETDLHMEIANVQQTQPGFDEYRFFLNGGGTGSGALVDAIGHDPFELIAYLSAVHEDFLFADVTGTLRDIFDMQYNLQFVPVIEIRTRTEEHTGSGTNPDGSTYSYSYTVVVEYEWHILETRLTTNPLRGILEGRLSDDQHEHFDILMETMGARQLVGSPFAFEWRSYVTSLYGWRPDPFGGSGREYHTGIDIALPTGTPILATHDGVITSAVWSNTGYGNNITITGGNGISTRYAHMDRIDVSQGQAVRMGDVIGTVGDTGRSTGPHLHFEVWVLGERMNPLFFVMTSPD